MYTTEEQYVRSLQVMIDHFKKPMETMVRSGILDAITEEDIRGIFANVEEFFPINKHMKDQLKEVIDSWDHNTSMIGELFVKTAPFFKVYNKYGNNYETAIATLDRCMEDAKFAQIVQNLNEDLQGSVSLESLLIMPVQRIPRYNLLLRDLIAKTDDTHVDFANLSSALELYESVMEYLDADITLDENRKKFMSMSKMKGAQQLIKAHRVLIKEEVLGLGGDRTDKKSKTKVQLWLFNDVVVHLKTTKSKSKTNIASAKHTWPLNLTWLKDQKDDTSDAKLPYCFSLVGPLKTLNLRFPDPRSKQDWWKEIENAVKAVLNDQIAPDDVTRYGEYSFPDEKGKYDGWWCFGRIHGKGKFEYLGNTYYGDWEYNCKSGKGRMDLVTGERYEGEFATDKPNGKGKFFYNDGSVYEGEFLEGYRCGVGQFRYSNGDEYNGSWKENLPSGDGSYVTVSGFHYAGGWFNGKLHGNGRLVSPNGRYYDGDFCNGLKDGFGKLDYANGDQYIGQWKDDKRHGYGIFYSDVEGKYEGYWVADLREGPGRQEYVNGNSYDGAWKRGMWSGRGILRCVHGGVTAYDGEWLDGHIHGKGTLTLRSGDTYVGHFKEDEMDGTGKMTSINSIVFDGKWAGGRREGKCVLKIGPTKYQMAVKSGMMDEGERSFMTVPDMPLLHFDL
eukprot:TRINITY_DN2962_c0_g1_i1.p1 TRINITY_DN2962_c0_g1~~TRINITY_DN2962_c0_g1_i1.p1  ORF type:complete len:713 (+),score=283.44 TRINITY_DN2962_c0_g1_i1:127-2139(+)